MKGVWTSTRLVTNRSVTWAVSSLYKISRAIHINIDVITKNTPRNFTQPEYTDQPIRIYHIGFTRNGVGSMDYTMICWRVICLNSSRYIRRIVIYPLFRYSRYLWKPFTLPPIFIFIHYLRTFHFVSEGLQIIAASPSSPFLFLFCHTCVKNTQNGKSVFIPSVLEVRES